MSETGATLAIFAEGWQTYQDHLSAALAPLTPEQLDLRAAPDLRSIGELARHIIGVRAGWFHYALGEGDAAFAAYREWNHSTAPRTGAELAEGLTATWQVIHEALGRYTLADLQETFQRERQGRIQTLQRGWVVWHVLEHDLHHGGEIGYSLGMHGLKAVDI
ncbi:MAG TPA: DinB family protein [Ktedonobacterales bacterium]|nr:DinB family protein [Ktedonobacterales bacterium]